MCGIWWRVHSRLAVLLLAIATAILLLASSDYSISERKEWEVAQRAEMFDLLHERMAQIELQGLSGTPPSSAA